MKALETLEKILVISSEHKDSNLSQEIIQRVFQAPNLFNLEELQKSPSARVSSAAEQLIDKYFQTNSNDHIEY